VLVVKGEEKRVSTSSTSIEDLLKEQNVEYDEDDIISEPLDTKIAEGSKIEVVEVSQKTVKETKEIPFKTTVVDDKNLLKGKTEVQTKGKAGENELVYKVVYHDGKEIEKELVEEIVLSKPVDELVKKGSKVEVAVSTSRGESSRPQGTTTSSSQSSSNREHMSVVSTAYYTGSITATGTKTRWGVIAVDPRIIPYGTKVYIPQFDQVFVAEDTGGAIKGNKIDIYMNDRSSAINWGRRTIDIYVLK